MSQTDVKPRLPGTVLPYPPQQEEEQLTVRIPGGGGTIWSVKIPKFLYDKWMHVEEGGVHLGTLVIDSSSGSEKVSLRIPHGTGSQDTKPELIDLKAEPVLGNGAQAGPSRLVKSEPPAGEVAQYNTSGLPKVLDMNVQPQRAKNTWVFSETRRQVTGLKMDGTMFGKRKREQAHPTLLGPVAHECTCTPSVDSEYHHILTQRRIESENANRPIIALESVETNRGRLNQMNGGRANATSTMGKTMVTNTSRLASADKSIRLPRSTLLNQLFGLFEQKPYWSITLLKVETKQPDAWIREVLKEIATQMPEGPYRGLFHLKPEWKNAGGRAEGSGSGSGAVKDEAGGGEGDNDEEEDWDEEEGEDEEDDYEEVVPE